MALETLVEVEVVVQVETLVVAEVVVVVEVLVVLEAEAEVVLVLLGLVESAVGVPQGWSDHQYLLSDGRGVHGVERMKYRKGTRCSRVGNQKAE